MPSGVDSAPRSAQSLDRVSFTVIAAAIEVHRTLGSGLLESAYRKCLAIELRRTGLKCEQQRKIPLTYKGERVGTGYQADLIVEGCIVVEVKAVAAVLPIHEQQLLTYLRLTGCPVGLLLNFGEETLKRGLRRVVNNFPDGNAEGAKAPRNAEGSS